MAIVITPATRAVAVVTAEIASLSGTSGALKICGLTKMM
jgi:hypothetical protein